MKKSKDYAGQKHNILTLIRRTDKKGSSNAFLWECLCDCGNTTYQRANQVINGDIKSCGCKSYDVPIDYAGQKYNSLTFVERGNKTKEGRYQWKLLCDCGETTYQIPWQVINGIVKTCGHTLISCSSSALKSSIFNTDFPNEPTPYPTTHKQYR